MMPPVHFLIAYVTASLFTKNTALRRLAAIGGVIPDLDGVFILFDQNAFDIYHHVMFHPLIGGALLGLFFTAAFWVFGKSDVKSHFWKYFLFFMVGFMLHDFADIIGTALPVALFYPVITTQFSIYPMVSESVIYGVIDNAAAVVFVLAALAQPFIEGRSVLSFFSEKIDMRFLEAFSLGDKKK